MPLTEEQRALIRLLLSGDTYEEVADVLGVSPDEVRTRASDAAASLEREPDPDLPAAAVADRVRELEGGAQALPQAAVPPAPAPRRRLADGWPPWLWLAAGGALVLLVVVLALTLPERGEDEPAAPAPDREDTVTVDLAPVGPSRAAGTVAIIRLGDRPAVDLAIRGLGPSGPKETYVLWFVGARDRSLPIAFQTVGADGRMSGRAPIPSAATGLLPEFETVDLTLTRKREAAAAISTGVESGTLPERAGTVVLRGALPR